ncbi:HotDog domain-containing protein [Xylaria castorea]|nr:HotDog domain-containing protein [Xylaria castorea]
MATNGVKSHDFHTAPSGLDSETTLQSLVASHPLVADFRQRPAVKESRSILRINDEDLPYHLTCTTLAGPDMTGRPYVFADDQAGSLIAFYHFGKRIAGHSGIVHGGIAGVLLDECMGRACFPRLAGQIGVTAKLELDYKSPIPVHADVLIRADTVEVQGRKAWVNGSIEDARDGKLLVKATGLFIEPKWAADIPKVM